jgi:hypothetical protein
MRYSAMGVAFSLWACSTEAEPAPRAGSVDPKEWVEAAEMTE